MPLAFRLALSVACLLVASLVSAAELSSVKVIGLEPALHDNVRARLSLDRMTAAQRTQLSELRLDYLLRITPAEVRESLEPFGYYDAQVDVQVARDGDRAAVTIRVDPGLPVKVRELALHVEGPARDDAEVAGRLSDFQPQPGDVLDHRVYEDSKAAIARGLAEHGYFDAELATHRVEVTRAEHAADIALGWRSGERFRFGRATFDGSQLQPGLLDPLVPWQRGEPFDADELVALQRSLAETEYFGAINLTPQPEAAVDGEVPVQVTLVPAKRSVYRAGLRYGTDAGAGVGAVAQAGAIHAALGRHQRHLHRHLAVHRRLGLRGEVDGAEVFGFGQRTLQRHQLVRIERLATLPRHQRVEQARLQLRPVERRAAETEALAAAPAQRDVGGVLGAGDLDAMGGQLGVEVAVLGQAAGDRRLAVFVDAMVEHVAGLRLEIGQASGDFRIVAGRPLHVQRELANLHRQSRVDADGDGRTVAVAGDLHVHLGVVVAERLEAFADFGGGDAQQVIQAQLAQLRALRGGHAIQRQPGPHVVVQGRLQPDHLHRGQLGCRHEAGDQQAGDGQGKSEREGHRPSLFARPAPSRELGGRKAGVQAAIMINAPPRARAGRESAD